ncbi:MAG: ATP12 family protein [Alphaproteobacteria bacterium]
MKRFYRAVDIAARGGRFEVVLDAKPLASPGKRPFLVGEAVARAVAAEWRAQGETVKFDTMPIMLLAARAVDLVGLERARVIGEVAGFAQTDMLCYRAEGPADLVARQDAAWQPWLDWAAQRYGARLAVVTGVMYAKQPAAALTVLRAAVAAHDDWRLSALMQATQVLGSLVLGLAVVAGAAPPDQAIAVAELDEAYQSEKWGDDPEAAKRRATAARDVAAAARLVGLLEG